MSRPEAANSTTVRATSPAINPWRRRWLPPPATARLVIEERRSTLRAASAGSMPNRMLVNNDTARVKPITRPSRGTPVTGRKCSGNSRRKQRRARKPTPMPTAPPTSASSRFSTQICFWICQREAPNASGSYSRMTNWAVKAMKRIRA